MYSVQSDHFKHHNCVKSVRSPPLSNHLAEEMAHSQIRQAALQCIFTWKCRQSFYRDS